MVAGKSLRTVHDSTKAAAIRVVIALVLSSGLVGKVGAQTPVPTGSPFLVTSNTFPSHPLIESDLNGDFVVVWRQLFDIQGQRLASDGSFLGTEFSFSDAAGLEFGPSLAVGPEGDFVVVGIRQSSLHSYPGVLGRFFDANGEPGATFTIAEPQAETRSPDVEMKTDGDFVAVWSEYGVDIQARLCESNGTCHSPFQVNNDTSDSQTEPAVAVDADGSFVVVWESDNTHIQGRQMNSDGTPKGEQFQINTDTTNSQLRPEVVVVPDGAFVVVWESSGSMGSDDQGKSIQGRRFASNGTPLGQQFQINTYSIGDQVDPAVAVESSGSFIVVWTSDSRAGGDTGSKIVQGQRYASDGSTIGMEFQVGTDTFESQSYPDLAVSSDGNFVVTWNSIRSGSEDTNQQSIQGQLFSTTPIADLLVAKDDGVLFAVPGQSTLTYTIIVANAGPSDVPMAQVIDTLDPNLIACTSMNDPSGGALILSSMGADGSLDDTVNMPVGSSIEYTVTCGIAPEAAGVLSNQAMILSEIRDPNPDNNMATDETALRPEAADLSITKDDGLDILVQEEAAPIEYTIVATNLGPSDVAEATITDTFASNMSCSWTSSASGGLEGNSVGSGVNLEDSLVMPVSSSVTYTVTCDLDPGANGVLSNTATLDSEVPDPRPENNSATDETVVELRSDLSITKDDGLEEAVPGETTVIYTIVASNAGPSAAPSVVVKDTFPSVLNCSWTSVGSGVTGNTAGTGVLNDTLSMLAGSSVTYRAECSIAAHAEGILSNVASISLSDDPDCSNNNPHSSDPDCSNNKATDDTSLIPVADLAITKTNGMDYAIGGSLVYNIEVSNAGPASVAGARVVDNFPAELEACRWACTSSNGAECTSDSGMGNIEDYVDLPPGGIATYTAICDLGPLSGPLTNTAEVEAPPDVFDLDESNNTATDVDQLPTQFPLIESFGGSEADEWKLEGAAALGSGWLVLTEENEHEFGSAILETPFASDLDLVIEFEYLISNGTGGNGLSVFLMDGAEPSDPGAPGACLGYAEGSACGSPEESGVPGGFFAIGFDTAGNFSQTGVGTHGCLDPAPDTVVLRGSQFSGYECLTSASLVDGIEGHRRVVILLQNQQVSVEVYSDFTPTASGLQQPIHRYDLPLEASQADLPTSLRLGFAATTGGSTHVNTHWIRNLRITELAISERTANWKPAASMSVPRALHTFTLLQDGRVLVVGSEDGSSTEIFDPIAGVWQLSADLHSVMASHTATLLPSGKVWITSGSDSELYDPPTDTWEVKSTLASERMRHDHTATLLPNGKVLVLGGRNETEISAQVDLYDPETDTWEALSNLHNPRLFHTSTLLPSGKVLVIGGEAGTSSGLKEVELYDPSNGGTSQHLVSLDTGLKSHNATLLPSGNLLVVGGGQQGAFIYDPSDGTITPTPGVAVSRSGSTSTLLPSGKVLVAGGFDIPAPPLRNALDSAELYDPLTNTWEESTLATSRWDHAAILLPSGNVLVGGGNRELTTASVASVEIYDASEDSWSSTADLEPSVSRYGGHTSTLIPTGEVLLVGGEDNLGDSWAEVELYDANTKTWSTAAPLPQARSWHSASLLPRSDQEGAGEARVLVVGGQAEGSSLASALIYERSADGCSDSCSGSWSPVASPLPRFRHTATLLASGGVLVVGGEDDEGLVTSTQIFDPDLGTWTDAGMLSFPRVSHTATLLNDGQVLIAGGSGEDVLDFGLKSELYNPSTGLWTSVSRLRDARGHHTATLLPSGDVLVAGGIGPDGMPLTTAELYDPLSQTWRQTSAMAHSRHGHTATLLPSGLVLVAGGQSNQSDRLEEAELYDPGSGAWSSAGYLSELSLIRHTATLLASGEVLIVGLAGHLYDANGIGGRTRPEITVVEPSSIGYVGAFEMAGSGFDGDSEASGSTASSSAINYPLVQLRSVENEQQAWWVPNPLNTFAGDPLTLTLGDANNDDPLGELSSFYDLPPIFGPGWHQLIVYASGVPSISSLVHLDCGLEIIKHPQDKLKMPIGGSATFFVESQGGRTFQWQQCQGDPETTCNPDDHDEEGAWLNIPDATAPSYTIPLINGPESGTRYRAVADSGCAQQTSESALLTVEDEERPIAEVVAPSGGEFWLLSELGGSPNTEVISWSMSDNIRVCDLRVSLWSSEDGGGSYSEVEELYSEDTFFADGSCVDPITTTNFTYEVPVDPPSGTAGSLYKIQVEVADHLEQAAGLDMDGNPVLDANITCPGSNPICDLVRSPDPFFIVQPNNDSVKTLILWNSARMAATFPQDNGDIDDLKSKLLDLASHPLVRGRVIDLDAVDSLAPLYAAWDNDSKDTALANGVLFDPGNGLQSYLLNSLYSVFTGVENLVLVGDDRIIPMARIEDQGTILHESDYAGTADLSSENTTVGQALAENQYLSDDPLAVRTQVALDEDSGSVSMTKSRVFDLGSGEIVPNHELCMGAERDDALVWIPEVAVGRLVEEPGEIIKTIATFISQGGLLDLETLEPDSPQVLVTGYDFLLDSGGRIAESWQRFLDAPDCNDGNGCPEVSTELLAAEGWDESSLLQGLCGEGGLPYPIASLNGHANHYSEGVPGDGVDIIAGLDAADMLETGACGSASSLDLAGGVYYAVGCHGGLPVAGSDPNDADHSLDLPQAFLSLGVVSYIANTGYGWGLVEGPPGYGERLVVLMTEELTLGGNGGTITVGEAVRRAKLRYFMEDSGCFDAYDQKSLMQWSLFGLPMYAVRSGSPEGFQETVLDGRPRSLEEVPEVEVFDGVTVRRRDKTHADKGLLPNFLTRLDLSFDFSAEGIYFKRDSLGNVLCPLFDGQGNVTVSCDAVPGCPEETPDSEPITGCYYELNGLASGQADLPIQPYFVYDSRLAGTSQHGVLWKGGVFAEEDGWRALRAVLQSNNNPNVVDNLGPIARNLVGCPDATRLEPGADPNAEECPATDLELNTLVVPTGESVQDASGTITSQRRDLTVDLEVFYFNDANTPANNCDRSGPELGAGPIGGAYHRVNGTLVEWEVSPPDGEDVWRILVVLDDGTLDATNLGRWVPIELENDGSGTWRASFEAGPGADLIYVLQAVDTRGNVSWLLFDPPAEAAEPSSGIPAVMPGPVQVLTAEPEADLVISQSDSVDPVLAGDVLAYTVTVTNHGPSAAEDVTVQDILPSGVEFLATNGCLEDLAGVPTCTFGTVEANTSRDYTILLRVDSALPSGTMLSHEATVSSSTLEANPGDESRVETTRVANAADLVISKVADPDPVQAGHELTYTVTVRNNGPSDALDVVVTDTFDSSMTFVSSEGCTEDPVGTPTCSLGTVESDESKSITLVVQVNTETLAGLVTNQASVASSTPEHAPGDEFVVVQTMVETAADLSLTQMDSVDSVVAGESLIYTLTVSNDGPSDAHDVVVSDTLPGGVVPVASTGCAEDPAGFATCTLGTLLAGASAQYTLEVFVESSTTGVLSHEAEVDSSTADPNTANNTATEETTVTTEADLAIRKGDSEDPVVSETFTYTLEVENFGPSDATNVEATDVLPEGLLFETSPDGCVDVAGTVTCGFGDLAVGDSASRSFSVTMDSVFPPQVTNIAEVSGDDVDPVNGNNTDSEITVLDITPPRVDQVERETGDALLDCATIHAPPRKIRVSFSEPVFDPPGDDDPDDVTHVDNYLLVAAGADRSFDTDLCGNGLGDDTRVSIDQVTYDETTQIATLEVQGGEPLADDLYRLLVCGSTSIVDLAGNPLDGDGDGNGGDDFRLTFRVEAAGGVNLLKNGHFDCDLGGWTLTSTHPDEIEHSGEDFEGSTSSGSAQITNLTSSETFRLGQCVRLVSTQPLRLGGQVRLQIAADAGVAHLRRCEFFSGPLCDDGTALGEDQDSIFLTDTGDAWQRHDSLLTAPPTASSARCGFEFLFHLSGAEDFVAGLDALFIDGGAQIFTDGFESGDTSSWSLASGEP